MAYLKFLNFCDNSLILGSGNGFLTSAALTLRKSVKTLTSPVFLGWTNVGAAHSESEFFSNTPMPPRRFISFLVVSVKTTVYVGHIKALRVEI